jgi:hypothetical protein
MTFGVPTNPQAVVIHSHGTSANRRNMIGQLISDSRKNLPLLKSAVLSGGLNERDLPEAVSYLNANLDRSSYHLLFAIRRASPVTYGGLDPDGKAKILCDALAHVQFLNDWGYLDPSGSHDGEAALALLELGRHALLPLEPILDDERPAPLYGSETATLSSIYKFRRKDFAHRYLALILGRPAEFDADPSIRDRLIEQLKTELKGKE